MTSIQIWRRDRPNKSYEKQNNWRQNYERRYDSNQDANRLQEVDCVSPEKSNCFHIQKYVTGLMTTQVLTDWLTSRAKRRVDSSTQGLGLSFFGGKLAINLRGMV